MAAAKKKRKRPAFDAVAYGRIFVNNAIAMGATPREAAVALASGVAFLSTRTPDPNEAIEAIITIAKRLAGPETDEEKRAIIAQEIGANV